jgi:hypothetical protein
MITENADFLSWFLVGIGRYIINVTIIGAILYFPTK